MYRTVPASLIATVLLFAAGCTKQADCKGTAQVCSGSCVELRSDNLNCGACGTACSAGQVCSNGACSVTCAAGLVNCGGHCIDPATDRVHCGASGACTGGTAGAACGDGQLCSAGQCVQTCSEAQAACPAASPTYCADLTRDANNCGACGATCEAGSACSGGSCVTSCPAAQLACGGRCIDPMSDPSYCGAAPDCTGGSACTPGNACYQGRCEPLCAPGQVMCAGQCVDPLTDMNHCGATGACTGTEAGAVCAAAGACIAGGCVDSCTSMSFAAAVTYPASSITCGADVGDVNGDAVHDIVVANCFGDSVSVYLGKGDGTFDPQVTYPVPGPGYFPRLVDMDNDGHADVVTGGFSQASILWNAGDGTLGTATVVESSGNAAVVADLDGDGWNDVVVSTGGATNFYLNGRNRTFTRASTVSSGLIHALPFNLADLDGDGIVDFALGEGAPEGTPPTTGTLKVYPGNGDGTFGQPASYEMVKAPFGGGPAIGDVDGDGHMDVVVGNGDANGISVFLNDGTGALRPRSDYAAGARTFVGQVADLNGDGRADVTVGNSHSDTFGYFISDATGALAPHVSLPSGGGDTNMPVVADLNGDGRPDVVVPNYSGSNVAVFVNTCTPPPPPPPCTWTPLAAFDLTTLPGEATTANGGAGGQSAQAIYGRTAWYQTSDWNMLMFPMHLASGDDVFAVQADLYLPAYSTFRRHATLTLFNDPAPGSGGGTHGVFVNFTAEAASTSLNWWLFPTAWGTMDRTLTVPFSTNAWHTVRVEGRRSTCAFRVFVDGAQVDAFTKSCDTTGTKLTLGGNSFISAPVLTAWSNMSISKGTTTCVP